MANTLFNNEQRCLHVQSSYMEFKTFVNTHKDQWNNIGNKIIGFYLYFSPVYSEGDMIAASRLAIVEYDDSGNPIARPIDSGNIAYTTDIPASDNIPVVEYNEALNKYVVNLGAITELISLDSIPSISKIGNGQKDITIAVKDRFNVKDKSKNNILSYDRSSVYIGTTPDNVFIGGRNVSTLINSIQTNTQTINNIIQDIEDRHRGLGISTLIGSDLLYSTPFLENGTFGYNLKFSANIKGKYNVSVEVPLNMDFAQPLYDNYGAAIYAYLNVDSLSTNDCKLVLSSYYNDAGAYYHSATPMFYTGMSTTYTEYSFKDIFNLADDVDYEINHDRFDSISNITEAQEFFENNIHCILKNITATTNSSDYCIFINNLHYGDVIEDINCVVKIDKLGSIQLMPELKGIITPSYHITNHITFNTDAPSCLTLTGTAYQYLGNSAGGIDSICEGFREQSHDIPLNNLTSNNILSEAYNSIKITDSIIYQFLNKWGKYIAKNASGLGTSFYMQYNEAFNVKENFIYRHECNYSTVSRSNSSTITNNSLLKGLTNTNIASKLTLWSDFYSMLKKCHDFAIDPTGNPANRQEYIDTYKIKGTGFDIKDITFNYDNPSFGSPTNNLWEDSTLTLNQLFTNNLSIECSSWNTQNGIKPIIIFIKAPTNMSDIVWNDEKTYADIFKYTNIKGNGNKPYKIKKNDEYFLAGYIEQTQKIVITSALRKLLIEGNNNVYIYIPCIFWEDGLGASPCFVLSEYHDSYLNKDSIVIKSTTFNGNKLRECSDLFYNYYKNNINHVVELFNYAFNNILPYGSSDDIRSIDILQNYLGLVLSNCLYNDIKILHSSSDEEDDEPAEPAGCFDDRWSIDKIITNDNSAKSLYQKNILSLNPADLYNDNILHFMYYAHSLGITKGGSVPNDEGISTIDLWPDIQHLAFHLNPNYVADI